ncbi:hypothetical protein J4464_00115 [Candidatus Woesearchaeota archaeon]|nr:hypothetical protein [Candidatus Woesearchaeota archaeon]
MAKCELCKSAIAENFLGKLFGTVIKDAKGKKHGICSECQRKFKKEEILSKL